MSGSLKPIKVYGKGGPNPPKVAFVLQELGLAHEIIDIPFSDVKGPEYLAINPNGRLPSIHDPNTNLTIWESGAILLYLVERYDTEKRLSFETGSNEDYLAKQWLFFQASGQGPYYGQAAWFLKFHPESVPSAVDRYLKEINRVCGVLEGHLKKQKVERKNDDGPWLVGGRISYADIAFLSWQLSAGLLLDKAQYNADDFPLVKEWTDKILDRKAIRTAVEGNEQIKKALEELDRKK